MKKTLSTLAILFAMTQGAWAQLGVGSADELHRSVENTYAIQLKADIEINSLLDIKKDVSIDLNGHKLIRTGSERDKRNGQVIWVERGATLTIKDTSTGGTITGGHAFNGGGIWNDGTLIFENGIITGCTTELDEKGVDGRGAGIFNNKNATIIMTGGTITGNEAIDNAHGGAGIFNDGTLIMKGGTVTGNKALRGGGIKSYGSLKMEGNIQVKGNTGGDVWLGEGKIIDLTGALSGGKGSIGIEMERVDYFTNNFYASGTNSNTFFPSNSANLICNNSNKDELKMRIGYYYCYWDKEAQRVVRELRHVYGDVHYLTGGKNANIGENMSESWYIVDGTIDYSMRVWCYNKVNIILCNNSKMTIGHGLKVFYDSPHNAKLRIFAQSDDIDEMGKLISHCDAAGEAGIGSVENTKMGSVEFHGGYIEAEGDVNAAGIGGGENANNGPITIYDGVIKAIDGDGGAAIGGGRGGSGEIITIYGGDITAEAFHKSAGTVSFVGGAGIGGGVNNHGGGGSGIINIWGGTIKATGGPYSAGIGSGASGQLDEINIHGGTIRAIGGDGGCGIGSGMKDEGDVPSGGTIRISGGNIMAYGKTNNGWGGCGIGSYAGGYTIEISGGEVYAEAGDGSPRKSNNEEGNGGAGIGSAHMWASGGNIIITGGVIEAQGAGGNGVGIGWYRSSMGEITISGGKVKALGAGAAITGNQGTVNIIDCQVWAGMWEGVAMQHNHSKQVEACKNNNFARIETCPHFWAYTHTDDTQIHTVYCTTCNHTYTESHDYEDGYCTKCEHKGLHLDLSNFADNYSAIGRNNGKTAAIVTLNDRTFYKDGRWNTLCLPFSLTAEQIAASDLCDANICMMDHAQFEDGKLDVYFTANVDNIKAGTPYLVKWDGGSDIENLQFQKVVISSAFESFFDENLISFIGSYKPVSFDEKNSNTILCIDSENSTSESKTTMGAFQSFFKLNNGLTFGEATTPGQKSVNTFSIIFENDGSIFEINNWMDNNASSQTDDNWYTLNNQRLSSKPTEPGIYIHNGERVLVK